MTPPVNTKEEKRAALGGPLSNNEDSERPWRAGLLRVQLGRVLRPFGDGF
jgi:hypothetical protein